MEWPPFGVFLGIQPPMVSWGVLLSDATTLETLGRNPWIMIPGLAILVTVLAFNFLGDGLRDAVDTTSHIEPQPHGAAEP